MNSSNLTSEGVSKVVRKVLEDFQKSNLDRRTRKNLQGNIIATKQGDDGPGSCASLCRAPFRST